MSIRTERLKSCQSGMASAEFILSIPVFLVILLIITDFGTYRTAMIHGIIASRNAAWAQSAGGACLFLDELPQLVDEPAAIVPLNCTSQPHTATSGGFWQELDRAGGERLTTTVRGARAPEAVTARTMVTFSAHEWPAMVIGPSRHEFTMMSRQTFTHEDPALRVGYDREMQRIFDGDTGRLMDLFPNVFPGAQ